MPDYYYCYFDFGGKCDHILSICYHIHNRIDIHIYKSYGYNPGFSLSHFYICGIVYNEDCFRKNLTSFYHRGLHGLWKSIIDKKSNYKHYILDSHLIKASKSLHHSSLMGKVSNSDLEQPNGTHEFWHIFFEYLVVDSYKKTMKYPSLDHTVSQGR